jgi:cytochrome c-type biogenesis protein CcmH
VRTNLRSVLIALIVTSCCIVARNGAAQVATTTDSAALDARVREVASELRCPVCQGLSIQDSPSELAQSMRAVVREQMAAGKTADEVKAHFVAAYGEWVLLRPRARGFNLAVYLLPILAVLAGAILVVVLARRWSSRPGDGPSPSDDPDLAAWEELVPKN